MILIADSGSTKTDWILVGKDKNQSRYNTIGLNPYFIDSEGIYDSLVTTLLPQIGETKVKTVYFYGAGCSTPEKKIIVHKALSKCFPYSKVAVEHDLLGAARALLGNKSGFAAIIGTGSNTGIYNGIEIEKNIDSLGYILGDEGSGSYIGKKIVNDYMRGYLPLELHNKFMLTYKLSNKNIFDCLYNEPAPNRFLAGFCKFAHEHKAHAHIKQIVSDSFKDFFKNLVSKYPNFEKQSFNCVGSVGYIFKDVVKEVANSYSMELGKIIASPIIDLANYHMDNTIAASTL